MGLTADQLHVLCQAAQALGSRLDTTYIGGCYCYQACVAIPVPLRSRPRSAVKALRSEIAGRDPDLARTLRRIDVRVDPNIWNHGSTVYWPTLNIYR